MKTELSNVCKDKFKKDRNPIQSKQSFNEEGVDILFDEKYHTYTHNGNRLSPVTTYIKKFFTIFDLDKISTATAKIWGVEKSTIEEIWDSNKELSAMFGTAIHNALEHYEKYKDIGKIISDKRENEENYALPKHPTLKSIIKKFIEINPIEGEVIAEVLISDIKLGICGHADRLVILDWDKKICRIGDYKINVDSTVKSSSNKVLPPLDFLPSTKVSKYQVQMSVYANMLQKSGWTVEGLDVYIYEDEWRYFPLEVLTIIK